jgi:predicted secreted protein
MRILFLIFSFANFTCNTHPPAVSLPDGNDTNGEKKEMALPKDSMEVKNNSEFKIEIRAALSTGNRWMLEDSLDKNYLALVSSTIVTDSTEMAAKPDLQTFVFKTLKEGSSTISFVYKRPWRKNADANAERRKYFIRII